MNDATESIRTPQRSDRLDYLTIIRRSLQILENDWRALLTLAAIVVGIPSLLLGDTLFAADILERGLFDGFAPSSMFLMMALQLLIATTVPVVERGLQRRDAPMPVGDAIQRGLPYAARGFVVALVVGMLTGIGFKIFWLPGLIATVLWLVAVPAAVSGTTRLDVGDAMENSRRLTRGHRWELFGLLVVLWLLTAAASWLAGLLFGIVGAGSLGRALATVVVAAFLSVVSVVVHRTLGATDKERASVLAI